MEFTKHFDEMLEERDIKIEWVNRAIQSPDRNLFLIDGLGGKI